MGLCPEHLVLEARQWLHERYVRLRFRPAVAPAGVPVERATAAAAWTVLEEEEEVFPGSATAAVDGGEFPSSCSPPLRPDLDEAEAEAQISPKRSQLKPRSHKKTCIRTQSRSRSKEKQKQSQHRKSKEVKKKANMPSHPNPLPPSSQSIPKRKKKSKKQNHKKKSRKTFPLTFPRPLITSNFPRSTRLTSKSRTSHFALRRRRRGRRRGWCRRRRGFCIARSRRCCCCCWRHSYSSGPRSSSQQAAWSEFK